MDPYGILAALLTACLVFVAALCPGLALLHFAWRTGRRPLPAVLGVVLLLAPFVGVAAVGDLVPAMAGVGFPVVAYALWFHPGLMLLLTAPRADGRQLGRRAGLLYLVPYLLLCGLAFAEFGLPNYPAYTALAAVLVILVLRRLPLPLPSWLPAVVLLLVPPLATLGLRLPVHLAMAADCAGQAGTTVAAAPQPVSVLAFEEDSGWEGSTPSQRRCPRRCSDLLIAGRLKAVETPAYGEADSAAGFYRYELGPAFPKGAEAALLPQGAKCLARLPSGDGYRCLVETPIPGYSADYLFRPRGGAGAVESLSYEIVERRSGAAVAWTAAYMMPASRIGNLLDVPLRPFIAEQAYCGNSGLDRSAFLDVFLGASR